LNINENNIRLKIAYNDKIILFEAEEDKIFPKKEFSVSKSLEELLKIDKYFRQFDNLKEVFESLKIIISNKNVSLIKEEKELKLKIKNLLVNKEFFIELPLKEKDIKSEMESLIPHISSLNNKISNLENEIKEMKIDFDNKLKIMEQKYKEEIKLMEQKHKEEMKKYDEKFEKIFNAQKNKMFSDSKIVQSNEIELILSWFDKKPVSAELLLNANIDDNFLNSFFDKCGNKPNTMIFIRTTKNIRFGGFTSEIWPTDGLVKDKDSFIFSLTKKQKYKIINQDKAIEVSNGNWISFGNGYDLFLYNQLNTRGGGTYKNIFDIPGKFDLNGGINTFKLLNCEIYQINF
jgi:hypothetical protein